MPGDIGKAERTFAVNVSAMFYLVKAATPHMKPGSAIINTASINADNPSPHLLAYATTKGAIQNFTGGVAQLLADKGIRVNAVAPGPVWTPLIASTMPAEHVAHFGANYPIKRPAQPRGDSRKSATCRARSSPGLGSGNGSGRSSNP
jgi:NAD(P)-dependent dehydrogenase (short-subunit alcohol dehydrogenase family)